MATATLDQLWGDLNPATPLSGARLTQVVAAINEALTVPDSALADRLNDPASLARAALLSVASVKPKGEKWANVQDYLAPDRVAGVTDDRPAFEAARLTGRPVYAPADHYYVSKSPAWGDNSRFTGDGKGRTVIHLLDTAPGDATLWCNADLTGNTQGYMADFTLDGNCQRQGGIAGGNGTRSSGFSLRNAHHWYIDRVSVINPVQHGFDVTNGQLDYPYLGDGIVAGNRSTDIYYDQCDASNFGDDAFTCHSSDYIHYSRSIGFNPRKKENCNAFEIDGDSRHVFLTDNRSFNCYGGVEVKGHHNEPAAQDVHINGHISVMDVRSYHFRHIGHHLGPNTDTGAAGDPPSKSAYDITGNNMVSIFPGNRSGFQEDTSPSAMNISAFTNVSITDFTAIGDPNYDFEGENVVTLKYLANNINLKGMNFRGFKGTSTDIYVTGGFNKADRVTIDGVNSYKNSPRVIAMGTGNAMLSVANISAVAPAGATTAIDVGYSSTNVHIEDNNNLVGYPTAVRFNSTDYATVAMFNRLRVDFPSGIANLLDLNPGEDYYLTTSQMAAMGDTPTGYVSGGYFVDHSSLTDNSTVQTMTRNTSGTDQARYWRVLNWLTKTAGPWNEGVSVGTTISPASADATYLRKDTATATYLTKTDAGTTYLTQTDASTTYLSKALAGTTYLSKADAGTTYLSKADAAAKYAPVIVVKQSTNGDDTAAWQAALNACRDAGGGEVVISYTGVDWRAAKLNIYRNTTLRCQPGVVIKRKGNSYGLTNVVTGVNPLTDNADPYSGHGNIRIIGGTWDGNIVSESYLPAGFNLFYFVGARGIVVEDVTVRDMVTNHCLDLNGVDGVEVRRCRFLGYKDGTADASRGYVEAIQCSQNMDDSSVNYYPMLGTPSRNILVEKCTFGASGTAGTIPYPAGFGTHSSSNDPLTNDITVRGCTFEGQGFGAIVGYTYNNVKVYGNTFTGCAYGVKSNNLTTGKTWDKVNNVWITGGPTRKDTSGYFIHDNEFIDTTVADVSILGTGPDAGGFWGLVMDINVHDNYMKATTTAKRSGQNVRVLLGKNVRVHDNECENAATGILIDSCVNVNNHDNQVTNTTAYGIQHTKGVTLPGTDAKYAAANRIVNNHIALAGSHGIGNNSLFDSIVQGNSITDWGRVTPTANGILTSGTDTSLVSGNSLRSATTGLGAALAVATTATTNVAVTLDNRILKPDGALVSMGTGVNNTYGDLTYAVT